MQTNDEKVRSKRLYPYDNHAVGVIGGSNYLRISKDKKRPVTLT
jgi:hypothetical protein